MSKKVKEPFKSVEQIRQEWELIEARRPGGGTTGVVIIKERAKQVPGHIIARESYLIQIIDVLDTCVAAYHAEMGVLLAALSTQGADVELFRGQLRSTADSLESVTQLLTQVAAGQVPTGIHEPLLAARVQLHCAKHTLEGGDSVKA